MGWQVVPIFSNQVIVFGSTPGSGLFVYIGTPGHGNPPIFWQTSQLVDPYGNVLPATGGQYSYSGTPALGTLSYSNVNAATTDGFGNTVLQGETTYIHSGSNWIATNLFNGQISFYTATSPSGSYTLQGQLGWNATNGVVLESTGTTPMFIGNAAGTVGIQAATFNLEVGGNTSNLSVDTHDTLLEQASDLNTYRTGKLTNYTAPNTLINSVTATTLVTLNVETGITYHFRFFATYSENQSAGAPVFSFAGTAGFGHTDGYNQWTHDGTGVVSSGYAIGTQFSTMTGPTMTTANAMLLVEEWATFTSSGTFTFRAQCSIATDTFNVKSVIAEQEIAA